MSQKHKIDIVHILNKKSEGKNLSNEEIESFIKAVYDKTISDHQIGAFLMGVFIRGMSTQETAVMTNAMIKNGSELHWGNWIDDEKEKFAWRKCLVDKHSTGGVGDKVSLILAPILAACRAKVPMISGRGLGITGGTIDKLESIPGYRCELSYDEMCSMLRNVGYFIAGQSADIAPTDKTLYAMRNDTGTVASIPLITASIMSKKGVEDIRGLVLDVKFGSGAFMKTYEEAETLATSLVSVGKAMGINTVALLDRMDSPLGNYVGNALEIVEVIKLLRGENQENDLMQLTLETAIIMLEMASIAHDANHARFLSINSIKNGSALQKFADMLIGQGVNESLAQSLTKPHLNDYDLLQILGHLASHKMEITSPQSGYISSIDALKVGRFCHSLGAGKTLPNDKVDYSVGIQLLKKPGDSIERNEAWICVFYNSEIHSGDLHLIQGAIQISSDKFTPTPAIEKILY